MAVCLVFAAPGPRERSYFLARIERAPVSAECIYIDVEPVRAQFALENMSAHGRRGQQKLSRLPLLANHKPPLKVIRNLSFAVGLPMFFKRPSNSRTQESLAFSCLMTLLAAASASRIKQRQTSRALGPPMVRKHQTSSPVVHNNGFLDGFVRRPAKDSTVVDHGARSLMIADHGWA
jgi:hypothetical protein